MTSTDTLTRSRPLDPEGFVVPKEARLGWGVLNPFARRRTLPAPFGVKPTFHLFWARNALYHGLRLLGLGRGDGVLVPAFHCTSMVTPILSSGAAVDFYNVNQDCSPDFRDLEARINAKTRAVVAIHYFGFPQPIRRFRALCDDHALALIEDCAHVLGGADGGTLGTYGDISIFSLRKFLPLYDGGQLVVNNPRLEAVLSLEAPPLLHRVRVLKNILDKLIEDNAPSTARRLSRVLRALSAAGHRLFSASARESMTLALKNYGHDFDLSFVNVPMSDLSRRVLHITDMGAVTNRRRANYRTAQRMLAAFPELVPFVPELPEGVCPWVFPFVAPGWSNFHLELRARGIPAFTWGDVVHPTLRLEDFPTAAFLYENLVFLPIHQSLTPAEMDTIRNVVAQALSTRP